MGSGRRSRSACRAEGGRGLHQAEPRRPQRRQRSRGLDPRRLLGMDVDLAAEKLSEFSGVRRRFDLVGRGRRGHGRRRLRPSSHRDSRHHRGREEPRLQARPRPVPASSLLSRPLFTEVLKDEFGCAFDAADTVTFMDVYSAGEAPVPGVTGKTFLNVILDHKGHPEARYVPPAGSRPLPPWPDRGSRRPRHNHGGGRRHRDRPSRARRAFGSRGVIGTYGSTTYIAASGASRRRTLRR